MSRRCRRTDQHLCQLGRHLERAAEPPLWPTVAALALAFAVLLASGGWRA